MPRQRKSLELVKEPHQIGASVARFNHGAAESEEMAWGLVRQTSYWVYDPKTESFGPSKFVGFVGMDFGLYGSARKGMAQGDRFDGNVTRTAIAKVLADSYEPDDRMADRLRVWAEDLLGPGALNGLDHAKWKFITLL